LGVLNRLNNNPFFAIMVRVKRPSSHLLPLAITAFLFGCGGDTGVDTPPPVDPETNAIATGPSVSSKPVTPVVPPIVYVEELDQVQEYFKEQHDTSFSHTRNKNYFSFTAGKMGMPMRVALYGKPHFATSDFYGSSMSGVLREGNPDRGRKIATWSLSRDDVVAQLAAQGLSDIDYGWVDVKFQEPSEPLVIGRKYFVVCERIADGKHFFGAFSFGEDNPYAGGRHWLHPEHDLVFRSYVGNKERTVLEAPESNATEPPAPKGIPIPPLVPTPQYSEDKKKVLPSVVPAPSVTLPAPNPPVVPPGPPQPRLRSVVPLEQGSTEGIVFPDETEGIEGTNPLPLPPSLSKANEANSTRDSSKTKRRGLLPGLFPRK
jgi:hypothetical protein